MEGTCIKFCYPAHCDNFCHCAARSLARTPLVLPEEIEDSELVNLVESLKTAILTAAQVFVDFRVCYSGDLPKGQGEAVTRYDRAVKNVISVWNGFRVESRLKAGMLPSELVEALETCINTDIYGLVELSHRNIGMTREFELLSTAFPRAWNIMRHRWNQLKNAVPEDDTGSSDTAWRKTCSDFHTVQQYT